MRSAASAMEVSLKLVPFYCLFLVMHLGAVATLLLRYHNSPKIKDLLSRINKEAIVGTLAYSDPATGTVTKTRAAEIKIE